MARPTKCRRIEHIPEVTSFQACGCEKAKKAIVLSLEELEAIRLKDKEGLEQKDCAEKMEISRPTFQRILSQAREKIAKSLIEGRDLDISGGNYKLALKNLECRSCNCNFTVPYGTGKKARDLDCPYCGKREIHKID